MDVFAKLTHALIHRFGLFEFVQVFILLGTGCFSLLCPNIGSSSFNRFERLLKLLADRKFLSVLTIAGIAVLARGLVLPLVGISDPIIPDESSILLQAKTYMTGQLSNRINLGPDFSSTYILRHPSYSSMYPALRALPLVVGRLIGLGFAGGVWASVVALCVLTYWMLCAFVPRGYALVGASIVVVRLAIFSWWVNSYFGPVVTAAGSLLLIGGYARIVKEPKVGYGCVIGLGVFLMMTTRPFEGLVISIPFACALLVLFLRSASTRRPALIIAGAAAAVFVVGGLGLTMLHDEAVTGDFRTAPYSLYRDQVATTPPFLFENAKIHPKPDYMQERDYLATEKLPFDYTRNLKGLLGSEASRFINYINFYVGFGLMIPFALGVWALRRRPLVLATGAMFTLCLAVETWIWTQYASPAFGLFVLAIAVGLQSLRAWRASDRPVGLALSRWLPIGVLAGLVLPVSSLLIGIPSFQLPTSSEVASSCCWIHVRSLHGEIERALEQYPGKNVVVVDEGSRAPRGGLLVFNDADVAGAKTIWINADGRYNEATFSRFPGRRRWRLDWRPDGAACLSRQDGARDVAAENEGPSQPCFGHFGELTNATDALVKVRPALHG